MDMMPVFDMIGTVAFAVLGALAGVYKKLDVFGVLILALATAVGGGILRDVVIANTPPMAFRDPTYVLMSLAGALAAMLLRRQCERFNGAIQVCDAIGLGPLAAARANMAVDVGYYNFLTVSFLAVVTAVGGGIIRDAFIQVLPGVFYKEIYATAAWAGAAAFFFLYPYVSSDVAMYSCFGVTTGLRLMALRYHWALPVWPQN